MSVFTGLVHLKAAGINFLVSKWYHSTLQYAVNGVFKPFRSLWCLFPLATSFFTPDTYGDSVYRSVRSLLSHTSDTMIFCENSYHKQYHSDAGAY